MQIKIVETEHEPRARAFAEQLGRELPERKFRLTVNHDMSRGVCAGVEGICAAMQKVLHQDLHKKVLNLEDGYFGTFFDAPSAARQIQGLIVATNSIAFGTTSRVFKITNDNI